MPDEEFITAEQIAVRLQLNPGHVRDRLSKRKGFPLPFVFGGARRWLASDIETWIEGCRAGKPVRRGDYGRPSA